MLKTNLEILKQCQKFYQTLYKKQNNSQVSQELLKNIPKLVKTDQNKQLIKSIDKKELQQAINQIKIEKSPGIDGIPIEFYNLTFYKLLENDLIQLYNNILLTEKDITNTMRQAIITLIPKKETQIN